MDVPGVPVCFTLEKYKILYWASFMTVVGHMWPGGSQSGHWEPF